MHSASIYVAPLKKKFTKALNLTLIWKINGLKYFMIFLLYAWMKLLSDILEAYFLLSSD